MEPCDCEVDVETREIFYCAFHESAGVLYNAAKRIFKTLDVHKEPKLYNLLAAAIAQAEGL